MGRLASPQELIEGRSDQYMEGQSGQLCPFVFFKFCFHKVIILAFVCILTWWASLLRQSLLSLIHNKLLNFYLHISWILFKAPWTRNFSVFFPHLMIHKRIISKLFHWCIKILFRYNIVSLQLFSFLMERNLWWKRK